jgi:HEAT repeat protein
MPSAFTLGLLVLLLAPPPHIGGPPKKPGFTPVVAPGKGGPGGPTTVPGDVSGNRPSISRGSGAGAPTITSGDPGLAWSAGRSGTRATGARGGTGRDGSGRVTTGGDSAVALPPALDTWEVWWEHNKDAFLDLKAARIDGRTVSGSPGQLTGRGKKRAALAVRRTSQEDLDADVVPALLTLLESSDDREILNSATLALGRMTGRQQHAAASARLGELLAHDELQVRASAALGLGAAGDHASDGPLLSLFRDDSSGRKLVGGGKVDDLVRGVSALSLGLSGDAQAVYSLLDGARRLPDSDRDVKACAVAALGLIQADQSRAQVAQVVLMELLANRRLDPVIASVIPTTLGKMGARESVPMLLGLLEDRDADRLVKQSCVIALGQLATLHDEAVFEALLEQVSDGRDRPTRHFALIALGRMGAQGVGTDGAHTRLRLALSNEIRGDGQSRDHRGFAALASAIYGRGHGVAADALAIELVAAWQDEHDPSFRGAFALAAALLDHDDAEALATADLGAADEGLAGHAALALGLLEAKTATPTVRLLLRRPGATPALRTRAATALALLADVDSIPDLVAVMASGATYDEQAAVTKALGLLGDSRAVRPLLELAQDERAALRDRGFACVALGLLGERTRLPFHADLRAGTNYLAQIDPIVQVSQIL